MQTFIIIAAIVALGLLGYYLMRQKQNGTPVDSADYYKCCGTDPSSGKQSCGSCSKGRTGCTAGQTEKQCSCEMRGKALFCQ